MPYSTFFSFDAIGTHWEISLSLDEKREKFLLQKIKDYVEVFDKNYSRFRKDSLVTAISKKAGTYQMPDDFDKLFDAYLNLFEKTNGLFTPLIGTALESAGYDSTYSLESGNVVSPQSFDSVVSYNNSLLTTSSPVLLDFGAGGKGYLVDCIGVLLKEQGADNFLIDAGGDMLLNSALDEKIKIGLENPLNTEQVIGTIEVSNNSICGSAGNRRKWGEYHHIINPKTLTSPTDVAAVWTISESALIADSMSTVLYLDRSEKAKSAYPCDYFILYSDMTFEKSENFNAELFLM